MTISVNNGIFGNVRNVSTNSTVLENQSLVYSDLSDTLNCFGVFVALLGVLSGCFVINIVRKLDDDDLRSRFSLLCVLVCDVILAFSSLSTIVFVFTVIDRIRFQHLTCPFVYFNLIVTGLLSIPLALSLLCLAIDQVIAIFKPLYFRTSESTGRKLVYGSVIFIPVPVNSAVLIYWTLDMVQSSTEVINCEFIMKAAAEFIQYLIVSVVPLAISTPMIYAVVLWKISRQRCVHSENPLENIQNRRLVVSFLLLSASYFLLWMPTLAYFSVCYYLEDGCWEQNNNDVTVLIQIVFTLNYVIDPVTCAVRMEPIKQRIIQTFRRR